MIPFETYERSTIEEATLIWAISKVLHKQDIINTLTENEKLFLFSVGLVLHDFFLFGNMLLFKLDSEHAERPIRLFDEESAYIINEYSKNNIKYLIEIYNILGEKIAIGKILNDIIEEKIKNFDYTRDVLKMFYSEYLTEDEKKHVVILLNDAGINLIGPNINIDDLRKNIDELRKFFELMHYITNGDFNYNEKIASALLASNKYSKPKVFFDSLLYIMKNTKNDEFSSPETRLAFIQNISNILSEQSEDFRQVMAKLLLKLQY